MLTRKPSHNSQSTRFFRPALEILEDRLAPASWMPPPAGTTDNLRGVWGSGPNDLFAVGRNANPQVAAYGVIDHYNGTAWTAQMLGSAPLVGVWGSGPDDVYAVGTGVLWHSNDDGQVWTQVTPAAVTGTGLLGVWGTSANNFFVVGNDTVLHYNGTTWTVQFVYLLGGTSYSVWGSGLDVYIANSDGILFSTDGGNSWQTVPTAGTAFLGIWGSSANDIYAVGTSGTILHYDGSNWSTEPSGTTSTLVGVWGSSANDVYAVGSNGTILHDDGTGWSTETSGTTNGLAGVWGSAANNVYAVGANGTILQFAYPSLSVVKTADVSTIVTGQPAGYTVTITNNGTVTDSGVTLSDSPLPAGAANDINWQIDTSGTGLGAGTTPADFQITGPVGGQSLGLSSTNISLAPGSIISVHYTGVTTTNDAGTSTNPALGVAAQYAVLFEGNGNNLQISSATIDGNIGVGNIGGSSGKVQFSSGTIGGRLDFSAANANQFQDNNPTPNAGPISANYSVSAVTTALTLVNNLSSSLGGATGTLGTPLAINGTQSINESASTVTTTVNGVSFKVFDVTSYSENNGNLLTIHGDGSGAPVVFNFGFNSNVNLGGDVALTGGLDDDHVLWNFTSSNQNIQLNTDASSYPALGYQGVLLAPKDALNLGNANLYGRVYGSRSGNLQLGANVYAPSTTATLLNTATVNATGASAQTTSATITITSFALQVGVSVSTPYTLANAVSIATTAAQFGIAYPITIPANATLTLNASLTLPSPILIPSNVDVTINGQGTLSGNGISKLFEIGSGANVTLAGGVQAGGGITLEDADPVFGAISNAGTLTVTNATFADNYASAYGGAIYNTGTLILDDCTFTGNSAGISGGAIDNNGGTVTVTNCNFTGNSAAQGGAIDNQAGAVTLLDDTLSGNSASSSGGGIANAGAGTLTLQDTIAAGNTAPADPDLNGSITQDNGYNLLGAALQGSSVASTDVFADNPGLAALNNNGGPTQTMALLPGSPAIGAGEAVADITTDQRGFRRPASKPDIGAFQTQVNSLIGDVYVLNQTASGALTLSGNARLNVAGTLQVDSSSTTAVQLSGQADVSAASTLIVGGDQVSGNAHVNPAPETQAADTADPLAALTAPTAGTPQTAVNLSTGTLTIYPGIYSAITVSGNAHLILTPGVYSVGSGGITISGNATVTNTTAVGDQGVLLYNTGALSVSGNASVNLTAYSSGLYAGLAIFQAQNDARAVTVSGNANLNLNGGLLYAVNAQCMVTISGNAALEASLVVNELTISGNAAETAP